MDGLTFVVPKPEWSMSDPDVERLLTIGASTGDPPAIEMVLSGLEANTPGTLIMQHMPSHFTKAFADRLDGLCSMRVRETDDSDVIRDGTAYIAPGGRRAVRLERRESNVCEAR